MKKNKRFCIILFVINALALSPLLCYYRQHFSVDAYGILSDGLKGMALTFTSSFRFTGALLIRFLDLINHNPLLNPAIDIVFFVIVAASCVTVLSGVIYTKLEKDDFLSVATINLAVLLSVYNVWFCDLLTFSECIFITAIGLLLCVCSIVVFLFGKGVYKYFLSGLLLILSTGVYQQFITVFAIYIIAIVSIDVAKSKDISVSETVTTYLKPALLIIVSGLLYFVTAKVIINTLGLIPNERAAFSVDLLLDNVKYFLSKQHSFLKGRGYFDTEVLTVSYVLAGVIWFVSVIADWLKNRKTYRTIFLILSCFAGYICSYTLGLLTTSHGTRTMFGLFSVFALFTVGILSLTKNKLLIYITSAILLLLIPINAVKIVSVSNEEIKRNKKDSEYVSAIYDEIEKYEEKEKVAITKIAFCLDNQPDFSYSTNVYIDYAFEGMLSLKNKDNGKEVFSFVEMPDKIYSEHFENENMVGFDKEKQLIFDGDTLYLCRY